jgi:hypothetical protein
LRLQIVKGHRGRLSHGERTTEGRSRDPPMDAREARGYLTYQWPTSDAFIESGSKPGNGAGA